MAYSGSCLDVFVVQEQNTWDVNPMAIGVSFAVAFIVGGLLALGCAKLCMKDFIKDKHHSDAESGQRVQHHIIIDQKQQGVETQSMPTAKGRRKRNQQRKKLRSAAGLEDGQEPLLSAAPFILEGEEDGQSKRELGLLDVLIKDSGVDMETELASQDFDAVCQLEKQFREQNIDTMIQLLRTLLNKQLKKGKLTPQQSQELLQNMQNSMDHVIKSCQQEKNEEEAELRKKIKDPEKLEDELNKLTSKYNLKMTSQLQKQKETLRQDLTKVTELTDIEIDEMLYELTNNLSRMQQRLEVERIKQAKALDERLEKRRLLAKQQRSELLQQTEELHHRVKSHDMILSKLIKDGKLEDRQKNDILSEYTKDLIHVQNKHKEEFQRQKLVLADKLRLRREAQTVKLVQEHEDKKVEFFDVSEKITDGSSIVESYHQLLQQQRQERDELNEALDQKEAEEIRKLSHSIEKDRNVEIQLREERFEDELLNKAHLTEREMDKVIALHQEQMEEFDAQKKFERKKMRNDMEEKLNQRRFQMEEDQKMALVEQSLVKEQQDATVEKILRSQIEVSDSDRQKILEEHKENMSVMNNQLQMSRMKQQKLLEAKVNKRRARVEDLRSKATEVQLLQQKEKEKQLEQLEKKILEEEAHIAEEKKKAVIEVRQRFAEETKQALSDQEKQLSLLIAQLQVGQARRQVLIKKQDKIIKELEDKLGSHVAEKIEATGDGDDAEQQVDYILQEHMKQISGLSDKLQDVKDRQNQILQEKLQQKKLMKEREIADKLEREAQKEFDAKQKIGVLGKASAMLEQVMLDTRHKMAMQQLETDMQAEMKKQREQLNAELEAELEDKLEEQKKSFLSQLAAITNMSNEEVNQLVTSAVIEKGGDSDEAKTLAKDMRLGVKRAKSQLGIESFPGSGGNKSGLKRRVAYSQEEPPRYYDQEMDADY